MKKALLIATVVLVAGLGTWLYVYDNKAPRPVENNALREAQYPSSTGLPLARFWVQAMSPPGNPEFVLDCDLGDQPHSPMMVYRVKNPEVTVDWAIDLSGKLGVLEAEEEAYEIVADAERMIQIQGSGGYLAVFVKSGAFWWLRGGQPTLPPEGDMVTKEEAEAIATSFVADRGILPDHWTSHVQVGSTLGTMEGSVPLDWGVGFGPMIDGLPAVGSALIGVRVDRDGVVTNVEWNYRDMEPYQVFSNTRSPKEAYNDMIARVGGDWYVCLDVEKVVIKEVKLGYHIDSKATRQDYVLPVYVFKGEQIYESGRVEDFVGYCNLLY